MASAANAIKEQGNNEKNGMEQSRIIYHIVYTSKLFI